MSRDIAPGQTVPVPFTLSETPDSTPTLTVYQSTAAGVLSDVSATTSPTVTLLSGLNYHAYFTVPAAALHGSSYQLLVSVTIDSETTTHWLDGGTVDLSASQASVDDLAGEVESNGTAIATLTALDNITTTLPVDSDASVTVRRARDYDNDDSRALEWTNAAGTWPDLTGATFKVLVARPGKTVALYSFTGSVVTPTGANQKVRLELTAEQLAIGADDYVYEGKATLDGGNVVDLSGVSGPFSVLLGRDEPA